MTTLMMIMMTRMMTMMMTRMMTINALEAATLEALPALVPRLLCRWGCTARGQVVVPNAEMLRAPARPRSSLLSALMRLG